MEKVTQIIAGAVKELFGVDATPQLSRPDAKFGDYATNVALSLAKDLSKNPREIAEQIATKLRKNNTFTSVEVAGVGFINLRVSARQLNDNLERAFHDTQPFGNNNDGAGRTAVVEYPSANVAKPFSVGHLRSGNQGWAARNLLLATGWRVITDDHLGDSGTPLGIWIVGFRRFSSDEALARDGVYELGRVYIATRQALKEEAERGEHQLADEVQNWLLKFEQGDAEALALSEKFNEISLSHIKNVMARLGIATDYQLGEKFFVDRGKAAAADLLKRGTATKNADGSVIVDLTDQGIKTPILLLKSNGAALYATTDLATILYREQEWRPDKVIYAVGAEQKFYFEQLSALARKLGIKTELIHLWFGTIDQLDDDGKRSKMSSRRGVVLMEELLDAAEARARQTAKGDVSADDVRKIALGAIKFTDFAQDRRTNILFDWQRMFNLTGFSGPYVQYAAVRVNKILRDNGDGDLEPAAADYDYEAEKPVLLKLTEYPEVVRLAANELEPHRVAQYVYDLARVMNRYYEATPVATAAVPADVKAARLGLLAKVATVFAHGLGILGIEIPEKM
jgi:arginyl-tRNA synthetase